MKRNYKSYIIMIILFSLLGIKSSNAEMITYNIVQKLGGETLPVDQPPWITAVFDDHGQQGSVSLTLTCVNLANNEYVSYWLFNLDPSMKPSKLKFTNLVKTGSFNTPSFWTGTNAFYINGEKFDLYVSFSTTAGPLKRFNDVDSLKVEISGISTLTAQSFNFNSQATPCNGMASTASEAYIKGIGLCRHDTNWNQDVPEPTSWVLALCGLVGMAFSFTIKHCRTTPRPYL
jgi:hypothetical protein